MTWIKICGITNLDDALAATDAGANALGFVFYPKSPRHVTLETVCSIVAKLPQHMEKVGVFVNETVDHVRDAAKHAGLTAVQLSGDESTEFSRALYRDLANGSKRPDDFPLLSGKDFRRARRTNCGMGSGCGRLGRTGRGLQGETRAQNSRRQKWRPVSRNPWLPPRSDLGRPARFLDRGNARRHRAEPSTGSACSPGPESSTASAS